MRGAAKESGGNKDTASRRRKWLTRKCDKRRSKEKVKRSCNIMH